MNKKQAKAMRSGYKEAGVVFWTDEMRRTVQKIHLARIAWKFLAVFEFFLIAIGTGVFIWIR